MKTDDLRSILKELDGHRRVTPRNARLRTEVLRRLTEKHVRRLLEKQLSSDGCDTVEGADKGVPGLQNQDPELHSKSAVESREIADIGDFASAIIGDWECIPDSVPRLSPRVLHALLDHFGSHARRPTWSMVNRLEHRTLSSISGIGEQSVDEILGFLKALSHQATALANPTRCESLPSPQDSTSRVDTSDSNQESHDASDQIGTATRGEQRLVTEPGPPDSPGVPDPVWLKHLETIMAWSRGLGGATTLGAAMVAADGPQVPEDVELALRYVKSGDVGLHAVSESIHAQVERLIETVDKRTWMILTERYFSSSAKKLQQLGDTLGLSRERVRQLADRGVERITEALGSNDHRELRWAAHRLRAELGVCAPVEHTETSLAIQRALGGERLPDNYLMLLLMLAGPYAQRDGFLVLGESTLSHIAQSLLQTADDYGVIGSNCAWALESLGCQPQFHNAILGELPGLQSVRDRWVRWTGGIEDKAVAVLAVVGEPMTAEAIVTEIGEGHVVRGATARFQSDARIVRTGKSNYGLADWGYEEYTSITAAIQDTIVRSGEPVNVSLLVEDLTKRFDVSPSSVRSYCSAPMFVHEGGKVRLRRQDESIDVDDNVQRLKGVYAYPDRVVVVLRVDKEMRRGSGRPIDPRLALRLGVRAGKRTTFVGNQGTVTVSWPETGIMASLGSLRDVVLALAIEPGDQVRLTFDVKASRLSANAVVESVVADSPSLSATRELTGARGSTIDDVLRELGNALAAAPNVVRRALRQRGDDQAADAIPGDRPVELLTAIDDLESAFADLPEL